MTLEEKVVAIVEKVRQMYKYDSSKRDILNQTPSIRVALENNKLMLRSITFDNYDKIVVYNDCIQYIQYRGNDSVVLIAYKYLDELIKVN